jgi:hypothetical protein
VQHVEPRDPLGAEQRRGVGVRLLEERGDQIAGIHLLLLGPLAVGDGALEHAVEGQGLARLEGLVAGHALHVVGEEALQGGHQPAHVATGVTEDLRPPRVVQQGVEQVLHRHVGVAAHHRLADRRVQRELELPRDLAHSFSTPARSG